MKDNIALIGFMGSGKSTVGKHLAKSLEMKFSDIDKIISAKEKKSINEIFSEKGEIYFRDIEREIIAQESTKNNCVISTGGGAIVDNENLKNLARTCFIVFLDCTLDCLFQRLKNSTTRPILNQDTDKFSLIKSLLESRKFLYDISADYVVKIDSSTTVFETVDKIKKAYINS